MQDALHQALHVIVGEQTGDAVALFRGGGFQFGNGHSRYGQLPRFSKLFHVIVRQRRAFLDDYDGRPLLLGLQHPAKKKSRKCRGNELTFLQIAAEKLKNSLELLDGRVGRGGRRVLTDERPPSALQSDNSRIRQFFISTSYRGQSHIE